MYYVTSERLRNVLPLALRCNGLTVVRASYFQACAKTLGHFGDGSCFPRADVLIRAGDWFFWFFGFSLFPAPHGRLNNEAIGMPMVKPLYMV